MKHALTLVLAALVSSPCLAQDKWVAPDKAYHFIAGTGIAGGATAFAAAQGWDRPVLIGFATGCAAGAVKEYSDSRNPRFHTVSWKDFAVTCLGAAIGSNAMHVMLFRQNGVTNISIVKEF